MKQALPYVPGQTPRPAVGAFDALKATVAPGMTAAALQSSAAWTEGLRLYRTGWFWECHEVLEAVWMAAAPNSAERRAVQGLIQLANAALKARMGRPGAVRRLCALAQGHFAEARTETGRLALGLDGNWVASEIANLQEDAR